MPVLNVIGVLRTLLAFAEPQSVGDAVCRIGRADTVFASKRFTVHVDAPRALAIGDNLLMLGNWTLRSDSAGIPQRTSPEPGNPYAAGITMDRAGRASLIPLPPGEELEWPRLARFAISRAAVLWSPPDTTKVASAPGIRAVRFATTDGRRWLSSEIVPIAADELARMRWGATHVSELLSGPGGLVFVYAVFGQPLTLMRRASGRWERHRLALPADSYPRILAADGGMLIAYVAPAQPAGNTLFVARAGFAGRVLGSSQRVSSIAAGRVYDPLLVRANGRTVYLVWREVAGEIQWVASAISLDDGATWRLGPTLSAHAGGVERLTATADSAGRLHIAFRTAADDGLIIRYAVLHDAVWRTVPVPREPHQVASGTPLLTRANGSIRLFWGLGTGGEERRRLPVLVMSRVSCRA